MRRMGPLLGKKRQHVFASAEIHTWKSGFDSEVLEAGDV